MKEKKIQDLFNSWAPTPRSQKMAQGHRHLVHEILKKFPPTSPLPLLDLGCGIGDALNIVAQELNISGQELYGLDLSENMILEAQQAFPLAHFKWGNAEDLPWQDNFFQTIISIESLYYYQNPSQSISEIFRTLQPGGWYFSAIEYFKENEGSAHWPQAIQLELNLLSASQWEKLFTHQGFQVKTSRIKNPLATQKITEYQPSPYFPAKEDYINYLSTGALLISAQKPF